MTVSELARFCVPLESLQVLHLTENDFLVIKSPFNHRFRLVNLEERWFFEFLHFSIFLFFFFRVQKSSKNRGFR